MHRRFRYGVQVNSLGLTEAQPENNVQRIVLPAASASACRPASATVDRHLAGAKGPFSPEPRQQASVRARNMHHGRRL
jgi:(2R)-ethylmalonyl-CoA mutase